MLGPSDVFKLPDSKWLIIFSFPLSGFFQVFVSIPILPEIFERLVYELNINLGEDEVLDYALNDICSDLYAVVQSLAMIASPLIGGGIFTAFMDTSDPQAILNHEHDHRRVADIVLLLDIAVFLFLFFFNGDVRAF